MVVVERGVVLERRRRRRVRDGDRRRVLAVAAAPGRPSRGRAVGLFDAPVGIGGVTVGREMFGIARLLVVVAVVAEPGRNDRETGAYDDQTETAGRRHLRFPRHRVRQKRRICSGHEADFSLDGSRERQRGGARLLGF